MALISLGRNSARISEAARPFLVTLSRKILAFGGRDAAATALRRLPAFLAKACGRRCRLAVFIRDAYRRPGDLLSHVRLRVWNAGGDHRQAPRRVESLHALAAQGAHAQAISDTLSPSPPTPRQSSAPESLRNRSQVKSQACGKSSYLRRIQTERIERVSSRRHSGWRRSCRDTRISYETGANFSCFGLLALCAAGSASSVASGVC